MHLCFSITAHGFGHGAISCAVINKIKQNYPESKITVLSLLPMTYLSSRIKGEYKLIPLGNDFGMLMHSPIEVDRKASALKYLALYNNWDQAVEQEKQILQAIKPDCLISNISPISLAAAISLKIPTASVAPFNWAQIYQAYCLDPLEPEKNLAKSIFDKMASIYQRVNFIYKPLPSVPFNPADEIQIASICDVPAQSSLRLLHKLPSSVKKIGLIALGGLPMQLDLKNWPRIEGWHWLVDQQEDQLRGDMSQLSQLEMPFLELLANSDLILTKPGYGTYCEIAVLAAHQKVRVITLERPDWPETPFLNAFLRSRVPLAEVSISQLKRAILRGIIEQLEGLDYPQIGLCEDGAQQLTEHLMKQL
ncbi:hypothetical protein [Psychromonas sp.]|uniref:hypothetical protein n=1 Tax=Psychromonas sp. TaxID=1884585 RepID=UPI0035645F73